MRIRSIHLAIALCGFVATSASGAGLACPDIAEARQVAVCPSAEELEYTFLGYCGDNARLYGRDGDTCESFENYRKVKDIALWESADGAFSGYVSCATAPAAVRAAGPVRMTVERKGTLTLLTCSYGDDIRLVHRTKAACEVLGQGECAQPGDCRASCE